MRTRLLILGGSSEASLLAEALSARTDCDPLLSLAGATLTPRAQPIPVRRGGYGGVAGLEFFLREWRPAGLIDATHPFAARMSQHAADAAAALGLPLLRYTRPLWIAQPGDDWRHVSDLAAAADALGPTPARVFLTTGRQGAQAFEAAPWHDYLIRAVDPPPQPLSLPRQTWLLSRGPFDLPSETDLLIRHRIQFLVTKNSGGTAAAAKLEAARALGLPIIMVDRPCLAAARTVHSLAAVLAWIDGLAQQGAAS